MSKLKAKHLLWRPTSSGSAPFIKIRYPVELSQTLEEMGRSQWYRKRLDVPMGASDGEVLSALEAARKDFEALCSGMWSANRKQMTETQQDRAARAYLSKNNLVPGAGKRIPYASRLRIEGDAGMELTTEVAERVEALLMSDASDSTPNALLLSDCIAMYKEKTDDKKYHRVLDRFATAVGDRLIEADINRHLHEWTQQQLTTRKSATVTKDLSIILSAIRGGIRARGLPVLIYKPAIRSEEAKQRVILSTAELERLMNRDMPEYLRCAFIAALTMGAINSEIVTIDPEDTSHLEGALIVRITGSKTKHRRRSAPLPWLTRWVSPPISSGRLRDVMTAMIKEVNPDASPYSLRHTFAHRHQVAHTPDVVQAQLAGWSSRSRHAYGLGAAHSDELLSPLIPIQHKVWDWLLSPDPANNVVNLRGKA